MVFFRHMALDEEVNPQGPQLFFIIWWPSKGGSSTALYWFWVALSRKPSFKKQSLRTLLFKRIHSFKMRQKKVRPCPRKQVHQTTPNLPKKWHKTPAAFRSGKNKNTPKNHQVGQEFNHVQPQVFSLQKKQKNKKTYQPSCVPCCLRRSMLIGDRLSEPRFVEISTSWTVFQLMLSYFSTTRYPMVGKCIKTHSKTP